MRAAVSVHVIHVVILVVQLVALAQDGCCGRFRDFRFMSKNVSSTLDSLLAAGKYDKRIRPDLGGPPTLVTVSVYVKSMSSVDETAQKYSMDTYFRQSWFDPRLRFSLPGIEEFSMSWLFLDRVWKPDTYIVNGHRSYLHRITVPNKFARVRSDGFVTYSMRLTLQASCPMHLRKFPLDSQRCPLLIGSYGYTASDIVYAWHPTGIGLEPGVELAQYDLVNITTMEEQVIRRGAEEFSMISATFFLRRNTGYYTLQVFVPCGLIVCSSWVSFWIDPDAVPARVSLAVTTVLSMTTMGFGGRASMPRVNHATALDWFVIMCFAFVFAVMLEYAAINFIDKVTVDLRRLLEERKKKKNSTAGAQSEHTQVEVVDPVVTSLAAPNTPSTGRSRSRSSSLDTLSTAGMGPVGTQRGRRTRRSLQEGGPRRRPREPHNDTVHVYAEAAEMSHPVHSPAPASPGSPTTPTSLWTPSRTVVASNAITATSSPATTTRTAAGLTDTRPGSPSSSTSSPSISMGLNNSIRGTASYPMTSPGASGSSRLPSPVQAVTTEPPPRTPPSVVVTAERTGRKPDSSSSRSNTADEILYADQSDELKAERLNQQDVPGLAASSDCVIPIELEERVPESTPTPTLLRVSDGPRPTLTRTASLRRCLSAPYRLWEQTRFLPSEEDVSRQMQSNEEPEKFTKIDIVSRKVFPIAFGSMLILYWIMYGYYISDVVPGDEEKELLYELAHPQNKKVHK